MDTTTQHVKADRSSGVYGESETVVFQSDGLGGGASYTITTGKPGVPGSIVVASGQLEGSVRFAPPAPGVFRMNAGSKPDSGNDAAAAVAVAPERIAPALPRPEDFNEFWAAQLRDLSSGEMEIYGAEQDGDVVTASVSLPTSSGPVSAWLHTPVGSGPWPAIIRYHGAGVYSVSRDNARELARAGFLVLSPNAHAIENGREPGYYKGLMEGELRDYRIQGRERRESLYFIGMFLRAAALAQAVQKHPAWNGKHLFVQGHSQGGGQALAAAGLVPEVNGLALSCPTHCDHAGPLAGRPAGWPQIADVRDGTPVASHVEAARYIDGTNFATIIRCPAIVCVCLLDDACPPAGIYAAANQLSAGVEVLTDPLTGHIHTDAHGEAMHKWFCARAGVEPVAWEPGL